MKRFLKIVFGSLRLSYLLKNYFIGAVIFVILMYLGRYRYMNFQDISVVIYYALALASYPFTMFVYDSIVDVFRNGNESEVKSINRNLERINDTLVYGDTFFVDVMFWFLGKFFIFLRILFLYFLSIFIAPIGMLYLYFTRRRYYDEEESHERIYEEDYQT